ncbi:MAG: APC family permease, partial [Phycisphaerae bacterium]
MDHSVRHNERPRELKWYHASAILYGDWGTSRFYVLGLAFFYSLYQSFWYVLAVGVLVALVGGAYIIICRCFPDGGGVYSSAKHLSRQLAVIGALLLCADFIVTAAMSAYDGMQYIGVPNDGPLVPICSIGAIILIGILNYFGLRKVGVLALIAALSTFVLTLVITVFSVPHLATGWHRIMTQGRLTGNFGDQWVALVNVVLALSGVEAVANMTGVMVLPVKKTARKTILPVLVEVVVLNAILAVGMCALSPNPNKPHEKFTTPAVVLHHQVHVFKARHPDWKTHPQMAGQVRRMDTHYDRENEIQNEVLRVMASDFVGRPFGWICGIVFGLLLISAVNTAVGAMMSIQYTMSRDNELPRFLSRLNVFGVPWLALIPAVIVPVLILSIFHDLSTLGDLYAIGVVGAITINLSSAAINRELKLQPWERLYLGAVGLIMAAIELTLAFQKHEALIFALSVLASGLLARFYTKQYPVLSLKARWRVLAGSTALAVAISLAMLKLAFIFLHHHPVYAGWLFAASAIFLVLAGTAIYQLRSLTPQLRASAAAMREAQSSLDQLAFGTPGKELEMSMPKVLVATRGSPRLLE